MKESMRLKYVLHFILITFSISLYAQNGTVVIIDSNLIEEESRILEQLNAINETWYAKKADYHENSQHAIEYQDINSKNIDSIYLFRLKAITDQTLFPLVYNTHIRNYIELYTKRYKNISLLLGLSHYYFPLFEEALDRNNCPIELKYLAVIESALNPTAVSRAGATGLWQFMYNTGKMYDLNVSTWVDDRRDPLKSTEAAARHLRDLSEMFWGDWVLAIAAYNCGPGNVTKAIQRSGGKTDFWEIYNYLPKETRGYVPAFYGAMYAMKYYDKYGITPANIPLDITDTIHVNNKLHFQQIAAIINIPIEKLISYNPQYKRNVIPASSETYVLTLPVEYISAFVTNKDSIYNYNTSLYFPTHNIAEAAFVSADDASCSTSTKYKFHIVKSGESLSIISNKYRIPVSELYRLNNKKSSMIHPGEKLIVGYVKVPLENKQANPTVESTIDSSLTNVSHSDSVQHIIFDSTLTSTKKGEVHVPQKETPTFITYKVAKGDTLWSIAQRFQTASIEDIKKINNINANEPLLVGKTLRIPQ
ncbi:MAG: transglycosylase SLT domain-containing protein [Bacteroidales bacterium]|nr:transglycosylase SLT domain-containing protein [Bacteroidales bacterium]